MEYRPLERLESYNLSYDKVPIRENSVIYCDIPYEGTTKYIYKFDYPRFYDWACNQNNLVVISSYDIKDDRFVYVEEKKKVMTLNASSNSVHNMERLYIPKKDLDKWMTRSGTQLKLF